MSTSQPTKLCALPVRTVMFRPICGYCGKSEEHYAHCDIQLAVLACGDPEHQAWADRDAQAWLGRHKYVRHKHFREDPLFQQTDLLYRDVAVPRTNAPTDFEGWVITKPSLDESALACFREEDGLWTVHVTKVSDQLVKRIPVRDLKLSLPEDKHGLVDAFEARLITGFYRDAMRAYEEALEAQKGMEEPTAAALVPRAEDYIVPALHRDYGICRVFLPPAPAPSASDPAPPPPLPLLADPTSM